MDADGGYRSSATSRALELETVYIENHGRIAHLVLNRPERRNAINNQMVTDISEAIDWLERDDELKVIVVRGHGKSFSSGYDLQENADEVTSLPFDKELSWIEWEVKELEKLWRCKKPTIAEVHGHCLAGGGTIAGFCDLIVTADDALLGQPESRAVGYPPELCLWPLTIGPRKTKELLFTGNSVTGQEALAIGMVNHSVPLAELADRTDALANRIAGTSRQMLQYSKRIVNEVFDVMGLPAMINVGIYLDILGHRSTAMAAFMEKRDTEGLKSALTAMNDGTLE